MKTSALEAFIRRPNYLGWDSNAYREAIEADWRDGRPETICERDGNGMGTIYTADGYLGYVGIADAWHNKLTDFRSIAKNHNPTWRYVYAKGYDGRVWMVGKIRKDTAWAKRNGRR
jgi:hypothetical protein